MSHPEPAVFVIFEDAGDRARRKRMPSLYNASPDGLLPDRFEVLGVGRGDMSDDEFRWVAPMRLRCGEPSCGVTTESEP